MTFGEWWKSDAGRNVRRAHKAETTSEYDFRVTYEAGSASERERAENYREEREAERDAYEAEVKKHAAALKRAEKAEAALAAAVETLRWYADHKNWRIPSSQSQKYGTPTLFDPPACGADTCEGWMWAENTLEELVELSTEREP